MSAFGHTKPGRVEDIRRTSTERFQPGPYRYSAAPSCTAYYSKSAVLAWSPDVAGRRAAGQVLGCDHRHARV